MNALVSAIARGEVHSSSRRSALIYTTTPADLATAEKEYRRREEEWREAGAVRTVVSQVDQALEKAEALQDEFNRLKVLGRPGITLIYLNLVRLFVLTRLPGYGKLTVIGGSAAVICGLSFILVGL